MHSIQKIAKTIRHLPIIEKAEPLWNLLRPLYQNFISIGGQGAPINLGGSCSVRIPAEFCGVLDWENYETENVAALLAAVKDKPDTLFLDIGCALGPLSLATLFCSHDAKVIAFDADLASLRCTERICTYAKNRQLSTVYGLLNAEHKSSCSLQDATSNTQKLFVDNNISGNPGSTSYVCIEEGSSTPIPYHSLDGLLFAEKELLKRPVLIKIDVEGAELLVLEGAKGLISDYKPCFLLSVHPDALPKYGHTRKDIKRFFKDHNYNFRIISIDHEEHWWCEAAA